MLDLYADSYTYSPPMWKKSRIIAVSLEVQSMLTASVPKQADRFAAETRPRGKASIAQSVFVSFRENANKFRGMTGDRSV